MGGLTIAEQFLMISTKLPTRYLYGFGENTHDTFLHDMQYRMWPIFTRDIAPSFVSAFPLNRLDFCSLQKRCDKMQSALLLD